AVPQCAPGQTCGSMPDGCGGSASCGTCAAGETCVAGGCERHSFFAYDRTGHLIGEYDDNGAPVVEIGWLGDAPVMAAVNAGASATPLAIHADQLGTPRALADATGRIVWRWDSDVFGYAAPDEDPDGDGTKVTFNLRFPGQHFDAETGLAQNG